MINNTYKYILLRTNETLIITERSGNGQANSGGGLFSSTGFLQVGATDATAGLSLLLSN